MEDNQLFNLRSALNFTEMETSILVEGLEKFACEFTTERSLAGLVTDIQSNPKLRTITMFMILEAAARLKEKP